MPITAIPLMINYLLNTVTLALKNKILEDKFSNFVKNYLIKHYFYTTTNTSETIYKRLKVLCGTELLPFKRACQRLHIFNVNYLVNYETKVRNDNLNRRRRRTMRENVLLGLIHKYHNFNF